MTPYETFVQIIGVFAMVFNILSYQQKTQRAILVWQLIASALFTVNFFLLGAYVGAMLNAVGIIRSILFLYKDKLHTDHLLWMAGFIAVYLASYVLNFTLFGKEFTAGNAVLEILPVVGMSLTTFGFRYKEANASRLIGFFNFPLWLVYNILSSGSIGAICCDTFSFTSVIVGYFRLDKKNVNEAEESEE
ncbi:MAG: YgjV family protein [Clostridiales bacterium]|nr:YgjV family protein [Clostridiales bacterium]